MPSPPQRAGAKRRLDSPCAAVTLPTFQAIPGCLSPSPRLPSPSPRAPGRQEGGWQVGLGGNPSREWRSVVSAVTVERCRGLGSESRALWAAFPRVLFRFLMPWVSLGLPQRSLLPSRVAVSWETGLAEWGVWLGDAIERGRRPGGS